MTHPRSILVRIWNYQIMTIGFASRIVTTAILVASAIALGGCAHNFKKSGATGDAISRAEVHGESADSHVQAAIPATTGEAKYHLVTAHQELVSQHIDLGNARKSDQAKDNAYTALKQSDDTLKGRWYVRVGQFIDRWLDAGIWIIGGSLAAAIALRVVSQVWLKSSGAGMILSLLSTTIFGVLSGGISLLQTMFDNIWFRKIAPAQATTDASKFMAVPPS